MVEAEYVRNELCEVNSIALAMITNISPSQTKISYGLITEITACDNLAKIHRLGEMGYEQAYERHNPVCCPVFAMCHVDTRT